MVVIRKTPPPNVCNQMIGTCNLQYVPYFFSYQFSVILLLFHWVTVPSAHAIMCTSSLARFGDSVMPNVRNYT